MPWTCCPPCSTVSNQIDLLHRPSFQVRLANFELTTFEEQCLRFNSPATSLTLSKIVIGDLKLAHTQMLWTKGVMARRIGAFRHHCHTTSTKILEIDTRRDGSRDQSWELRV